MRSLTPSGFFNMEPTTGFAPASAADELNTVKTGAYLFGHVGNQHERKDSNPVRQFWRLSALPGAHSRMEKAPLLVTAAGQTFTLAAPRSNTPR